MDSQHNPQYYWNELHHHQQQESASSSRLDSNNLAGPSSATEQENRNHTSYFKNFPPGYHFLPTDIELISYYLQMKVEGKPLPPNKIHEVDLYKNRPESLAGEYEECNENEWYFFTPRERKYKQGSRPSRSTKGEYEEGGYWKATGANKSIITDGQTKIGSKRVLVFYNGKSPKGQKTSWIMHEYTFEGPPREKKHENDMKLDDFVLCKIHKKKEKSEGQEEEVMNEAVIEAAPEPELSVSDAETCTQDFQQQGLDFQVEDGSPQEAASEPELSVSDGKICTQHFQQQALDLQVEDGSLQEAAPELELPEYFQQQEQDLLNFDYELLQLDLMDSTMPSSYNAFSTYNETTSQCQQLSSMDEVLILPNQMMQSYLPPLPGQTMQPNLPPLPDQMMPPYLPPLPDQMMPPYLPPLPDQMMQSDLPPLPDQMMPPYLLPLPDQMMQSDRPPLANQLMQSHLPPLPNQMMQPYLSPLPSQIIIQDLIGHFFPPPH